MKKTMIAVTAALLIAFAAAMAGYYLTGFGWLETAAISLGITSYNFAMRLLVGFFWNCVLHNRVNYKRWWFRPRRFEPRLYKLLRVKSWKKRAPTFDSNFFDMRQRSLPEVIGATCQAELVHETIIPLCFLPIAMSGRFGALPVFVITSVISALIDMVFVIIQRYNRPRLVRSFEKTGHQYGSYGADKEIRRA